MPEPSQPSPRAAPWHGPTAQPKDMEGSGCRAARRARPRRAPPPLGLRPAVATPRIAWDAGRVRRTPTCQAYVRRAFTGSRLAAQGFTPSRAAGAEAPARAQAEEEAARRSCASAPGKEAARPALQAGARRRLLQRGAAGAGGRQPARPRRPLRQPLRAGSGSGQTAGSQRPAVGARGCARLLGARPRSH